MYVTSCIFKMPTVPTNMTKMLSPYGWAIDKVDMMVEKNKMSPVLIKYNKRHGTRMWMHGNSVLLFHINENKRD